MATVINITVPPPEPITINLAGAPDAPVLLDLTTPAAQVITVILSQAPASPVTIEIAEARPGADGAAGADGQPGADGEPGASAYEVALANGFSGDEAAWLESLQGADGGLGTGLPWVILSDTDFAALSPKDDGTVYDVLIPELPSA